MKLPIDQSMIFKMIWILAKALYIIKMKREIIISLGLIFSICLLGCGTPERELTRKDLNSVLAPKTKIPIFTYQGEPFTGVTTDVMEESGVKLVTNYKDGYQHGELTGWHANGNKERELYFVNGVPEGAQASYYQNGQKFFESFYVNGKLDGTVTHWYETGVIQLVIEYREGQEIARISYDEEGNKIEAGLPSDSF